MESTSGEYSLMMFHIIVPCMIHVYDTVVRIEYNRNAINYNNRTVMTVFEQFFQALAAHSGCILDRP